jgi:hypothetical protein
MFKRFFGSRIIALWLTMTVIGFFIGYTYSVMDAKKSQSSSTPLIQASDSVYPPTVREEPEKKRDERQE